MGYESRPGSVESAAPIRHGSVSARRPSRGVGHRQTVRLSGAAGLGALVFLLATSCGQVDVLVDPGIPSHAPPITVLFVGDLMLGRGVAPIAAGDPTGLFEGVRRIVRDADLALANLESPLTDRAHLSANPSALEADPALASLIADAGFDVMSLANNHTGDAGPGGVLDTIAAVESAGMIAVGAGSDSGVASNPALFEVSGLTVAALSFDATGGGLAAGANPGVAVWEEEGARLAVETASRRSDLVVVSVHGGVEGLPEADPRMTAIAEQLAGWGADVIWGHGPHVGQPVTTATGEGGRTSVIATSLGNFLFDQRGPLTGEGAVLEILADHDGVVSYRLGSSIHDDLRVHFKDWNLPPGSAALVDGEWWSPLRDVEPIPDLETIIDHFNWGVVISASTGRVTGADQEETAVSFRHVPGPHPVRDGLPGIDWFDTNGMSAHLGIYRADDLTPIWVAGVVPAPVARVAACDRALAMAYSTLDDPAVVATGAAVWRPFGLDAVDRLPGPGTPACADIDGDGSTEPVILDRP